MLPEDGPLVAGPDVEPEDWLDGLAREAFLVVLAPASSGGWFGGRQVVAWAPRTARSAVALADAAELLEGAWRADEPVLGAAVLPYSGTAEAADFRCGVVRTPEGWRTFGDLRRSDVPAVEASRRRATRDEVALVSGAGSDLDAVGFRAGVRAVHEAVRAGNVYVLNLTRRVSGKPESTPEVAFAALRHRARADMAAFWRSPGVVLASASPERFVRLTGRRAEVCPIKGTRPRSTGARDAALADELRSSEKECAEHVMIVDLERNDLGRVSEAGSVAVDPLFDVVPTPYCHQMVSRVTGVLREDVGMAELLEAVFPCGSVTGAPKIAAMREIARLEASERGAYTGALMAAVPGAMDSSVLIRTAEYARGAVVWGTGGGITIDSDPAEEWLETVLKASPFLGDRLPQVALRETCRIVRGRVPLLARHLARLAAGGCGPTVLAAVTRAAETAAAERPESPYRRLALTVTPSGEVEASATDGRSSLDVDGGPRLHLVETATPKLPPGAAKPADRSPWDAAQAVAAAAGAEQAVLVDARGGVIDGATANVWARFGGRLVTPPAPPAVDGVARGVVLDVAEDLGYSVSEAPLSAEDLRRADEVFLSNALGGVVGVRDRSGPASVALGTAFSALLGR